MATNTLGRNPLATRTHTTQHSNTPVTSCHTVRKAPSAKRAHSPEPPIDAFGTSSKRAKAIGEACATTTQDKKSRRAERDNEFRDKYSRAFPGFIFFFDQDYVQPNIKDALAKRVINMGARVEEFFSAAVTHFITQENVEKPGNKENVSKGRGNGGGQGLDSPIRLRTRPANSGQSELLLRAIGFDIKIWSADKLESVLDRSEPVNRSTQVAASATSQPAKETTALELLLKAEKLNGTTERDPTQKRHDFIYFEKNSYFVLVEDMRQELATIMAVQYPMKSRDGKEKITYPVLYCHPLARAPFVPYDEKEEKRREKLERQELERQQELRRRKLRLLDYSREQRRKAEEEEEAKRQGELRRTQSLTSLRRRATFHGQGTTEAFADLDAKYATGDDEGLESAAASGYLASNAYTAASGNSVNITSTTGTTSNAGLTLRTSLPASLREKIQHEIVTSRKLPSAQQSRVMDNAMGPPPVPDRQRMLRKSRSTNTIRLPKRDEDSKPGYCESCRIKFEDFKEHIYSKRHRKFAMDDANFANLDTVLSRVRRRTLEEKEEDESFFGSSQPRINGENSLEEREESSVPSPDISEYTWPVEWDLDI